MKFPKKIKNYFVLVCKLELHGGAFVCISKQGIKIPIEEKMNREYYLRKWPQTSPDGKP